MDKIPLTLRADTLLAELVGMAMDFDVKTISQRHHADCLSSTYIKDVSSSTQPLSITEMKPMDQILFPAIAE